MISRLNSKRGRVDILMIVFIILIIYLIGKVLGFW